MNGASQQKINQGTNAGIKISFNFPEHIPLSYFLPLIFYPVLFYPSIFYARVAYRSFRHDDDPDACDAFYAPIEWHEHTYYCSV